MMGVPPDPGKLLGFEESTSLSLRGRQVVLVALLTASVLAVLLFVDLSPQVDRTLFFSTDDEELREDRAIREMFRAPPQIIISAQPAGDFTDAYVSRVGDLSRQIRGIDDVESVRDILHGPENVEDAFEHPMWRRLLVSEDGESTNLVVVLGTEEFGEAVSRIEQAVEEHRSPDFRLAVSGEPLVVEEMRRQVTRDMSVFGLATLVVFTLAMALLYRSGWIVMGTVIAGGTAAALTVLVRALVGLRVDILTPNIVTIVFVLTLLHVIFLTANWNLAGEEEAGGAATGSEGEVEGADAGDAESGEAVGKEGPEGGRVGTAVRWTLPPSFWAMITTGLGFLSLLLAPAKPARNFGISGALGTVLALVCAYLVYPTFLQSAGAAGTVRRPMAWMDSFLARLFRRRLDGVVVAVVLAAMVAVGGLFQLNTEPTLFAYFGDDIRSGLEEIDRAGGTSPLELVIRDAEGGTLAEDETYERMWALQRELETDSAVGSVLSLPVLMAEAEEEAFFSFLLSWDFMLDRLEEPEHDRIAQMFLTGDRRSGRFVLRMKESVLEEGESRNEVIERLEASVRDHGFEPALTGGLYVLQAKMNDMVASSLKTGILGLGGLFVVVAFLVSRSLAVGTAMVLGFSMIPLFLLAVFGFFGLPLDVIALPAANVALAIGVDDMVHLVFRVRRDDDTKPSYDWSRWVEGRADLWRAILSSSLVVVLGFGLLLLSAFPPTARLGLAVVIGAVAAAGIVLFVFPRMADLLGRIGGSGSA